MSESIISELKSFKNVCVTAFITYISISKAEIRKKKNLLHPFQG